MRAITAFGSFNDALMLGTTQSVNLKRVSCWLANTGSGFINAVCGYCYLFARVKSNNVWRAALNICVSDIAD